MLDQIKADILTLAERRGIGERHHSVRMPSLSGDRNPIPFQTRTRDEFQEFFVDLLRQIDTSNDKRFGGRQSLIGYLNHTSQRVGVDLDLDSTLSFDEIMADPSVQKIIAHQVESDWQAQEQTLRRRMLDILPEEMELLERTLQDSGLLPPAFTIRSMRVDGNVYDDGEIAEITSDIMFFLGVSEEDFPILASRQGELTPSSGLEDRFFLKIEITENNIGTHTWLEVSDPQIPSMILWHKFTDDELRALTEEKQNLEWVVRVINNRIQAEGADLSSLMPQLESIIQRVNGIHEA